MIIQVACATFAIYYLLRFPFCILSQIYAQALVTVSRLLTNVNGVTISRSYMT
jgi:hypothetical protein